MKKAIINEAYWLRTISCLAVVVTHAVNTTLANYEHTMLQMEEYALILIRFMAFFGTPAFVFISELLLAHSYSNGVPKDFFAKRIKFLLVPFIFMAFVHAVIGINAFSELMQKFLLNLVGGYTGYFILIIFQFYILHVLLHKHLQKWSPKVILTIAFFINISYLAFFNFTEPFQGPLGEYIWLRGYWLPFVGWIFYFALGYYCGRNYTIIKEKISNYKAVIVASPVIFISLIVILVRTDILTVVSSKRIDMVFYTTSIIFLTILLTSAFKQVPRMVLFISKFSFNIYLLHKLFLYYLQPIHFLHPFVYFLFAALFSVVGSIVVAKLLTHFTFGQYLIGKTIRMPKNKSF